MKRIDFSDLQAREAIVKELNTNLFVEASAGSGKTTSLVYRMVALIESGVPVDQICTITFTIAAADEFFARFQALLSQRTIDNPLDKSIEMLGPTTELTRARCLEALNNIDLCFNGTMDSFCNMVAHELPNELDIPSDAEVISEEEKKAIIKDEYFNILTDNNHPLYSLAGLFNKTFGKSFDAFSAGMDEIFDYRGYQVAYNEDLLSSDSDHLLDGELTDFINLINEIAKDGYRYITSSTAKTKVKKMFAVKNKLSTNFKDCVPAIMTALSGFVPNIRFKQEVSGTSLEVDFLKEVSRGNYGLKDTIIEEVEKIETVVYEYCFQLYFSFVTKVRDEIVNKMKDRSEFTFFDFLYYLTEKFKESCASNRELVNHVFERHSHILIDESQDTNPMQTELFFYLTSTKKTDKWEEAEPKEGSLFIVGDPKQSIYGFRDADVKAYNHTKELFKSKDEVLFLSKNYRSNIVVKDYFNKIMNSVLDDGSEPLTHPDIPLNPTNEREQQRQDIEANKDITLNGVYKYHTVKDRKIDANNVAELVKKIVNNENYKIVSKHSDKVRKIEYKDILIITKDKKIESFISAFKKNNIPLRVEAKIYFSNSPSVDILKKLLYLMFEPYQKQYFLDVVMSDLYKLKTQDIIRMEKDGFNLDISNLLDKEGNPLAFTHQYHQDIVNELHNLYLSTRGMGVSSTLFYLLSNKDYRFFTYISPEFLEYAYYVVELVKAGENDRSISSFEDAKEFLENSINDDSDIEKAMKFSEEVNQVKISNLHKVKGLQAPVVILAAPMQMKHEPYKYVDRINKVVYLASIGVKNDFGSSNTICKTDNFDQQMEMARLSSLSEEGRIEYVAATRAESVLIIGVPEKLNENYVNPWRDLLFEGLEEIPDYPYQEIDLVTKEYDEVMEDYQSIQNDDCHQASYKVRNPSGLRIASRITNVDEVTEEDEMDIDKALLGTMIHRLLECVVTSKNRFNINSLVADIFEELSIVYEAHLFDKLCYIADKFTFGGYTQIDSKVPSDLYSVLKEAEQVMCEVPFSYKSSDTIIAGVIDLLYKDQNGWHIIDYKTNDEDDVGNLEEEYQIQLGVYKKAVKQATGLDCDAHIYHIDIYEKEDEENIS